MKKMILLITISISAFIIPSCYNSKQDNGKNDKELSSRDLPEAVDSAFSAKYSTAIETKWEDAHENNQPTFKAKFMLAERKMKAEFGPDGKLIKEEEVAN
jgi:hypothetical protein